ncbi:apolipoprotein D [Bombyx mori]|uniref:Lipocalin/cytosolic fatty-acid binding domain-containing protein n=1 Tax=Bombyx mori TaxID=7091 RepID=A0A8R2ANN5_BOMMO|nr:apolipoprotein D [Bombyx mori]
MNVVNLFLVVVLVNTSGGQVLQFGQCPEVETMEYFDLVRFLGRWFEIERFPAWFEDKGHCAYKRFQYCNRKVEIEQVFIRDGIRFIIHRNSSYNPGDEAIFDIQPSNIDPVGIPLSVISTDYNNYAILFGCKFNVQMDMKYILAWILSREQSLPPEVLNETRRKLNSIPFANAAYLMPVNHTEYNCNYHWTAHIQSVYKTVDEN